MTIIKGLLFLAILVAVIAGGTLGVFYALGIGLTLAIIDILWKTLIASGIVGATALVVLVLLQVRK